MSLKDARELLLNALTSAGLDAYYGWGQFAAPGLRIFPADPWVRLGGTLGSRRAQRWELWVIAGRLDSNATFDELEKLVMDTNAAMELVQQFGHIEWKRPGITSMQGVAYLACRGIVETMMEV